MKSDKNVLELVESLSNLITLVQCGTCGKSGDICNGCARPAQFGWQAIAFFQKHQNLYYRDYNMEVKGLDDLHKAFIPIAQTIIKESLTPTHKGEGKGYIGA